MKSDFDALVIGGGVAGSAAAILLAQAGWRVVAVEQQAYPRRKVCGECVAAGNLPLLDRLGIGAEFRRAAGPELTRIGWMDATGTVVADMPRAMGPYAYGRALGRDRLDALLLTRAQSAGVLVLQPSTVRTVQGRPGHFDCAIDSRIGSDCDVPAVAFAGYDSADRASADRTSADRASADRTSASADRTSADRASTDRTSADRASADRASADRASTGRALPEVRSHTIRAAVVIDAHGSWERGPAFLSGWEARPGKPHGDGAPWGAPRPRHRSSDLLAFKANFRNASLPAGFLPVLALPGGYGGMVLGDDGRTTLACCIRRDTLAACRAHWPSAPAGAAVEAFLRHSCTGIRDVLHSAEREGAWLSTGPLRPGIRVDEFAGAFRVGNAAGESHPLIGEGISMALQSAALLAATLTPHAVSSIAEHRALELNRLYAAAWRRAFAPRLRLAAIYAHIAMRPLLAAPARGLLRRWPSLLGSGARLASKATRAVGNSSNPTETA